MVHCGHRASISSTQLPESVEGCTDCPITGEPWLQLETRVACVHPGRLEDFSRCDARAPTHIPDGNRRLPVPASLFAEAFVSEVSRMMMRVGTPLTGVAPFGSLTPRS
jgi:hypothetical protein